jgi:predicted ATPase
LFTDIEGSTRLWDEQPGLMRVALARHDEILRKVIEANHGVVFSTSGDGVAAAFGRAGDAVFAAVEAQRQLGSEAWPAGVDVRVRMGIHTGEAQERDGDYFGPPLNRAARVMAVGHGGQILVSGTTAGIVSGVDLQDLGEHRLRDLSGIEHLFQVRAGGLDSDFPRLRTADAVPGNMPVQATSFVGREREVKELSDLMRAHRLVTLTGMGGVGKTRTAVQVAAELITEYADGILAGVGAVGNAALAGPRYRDGTWFCELADIATGDAIVEALATTLRVRQQRGTTLLASIASSFREADALVVLDNCEHVLVSAANVLAVLLRECPGMAVLATSREPLEVSGEVVYALEPLLVPELEDFAVASPVFALFVERARDRGVHIDQDPPTRAAVVEICRRLDGLPLAIELAAARARTMSLIDMSTRLDERFRLLARTHTGGPRRQQTLWNVVDWSYQLLEPADQEVFSRLAVFLGGFTIEAAAAVSARPLADVEAAVWALTERSLVQLMPAASESRYQMLETLRHYGLERLTRTGSEGQARDAHLRYFVGFARYAGSKLRGPDEAGYVKRITNDLANLRAAHRHAVATNRAADAANLVAALHDYAEWRQFFELGSWAQSVLELAHETTGLTPALHAIAGWGRCIAGDFDAASDHARQGLAAEMSGGVECGWLHDVLAHCALLPRQRACRSDPQRSRDRPSPCQRRPLPAQLRTRRQRHPCRQ